MGECFYYKVILEKVQKLGNYFETVRPLFSQMTDHMGTLLKESKKRIEESMAEDAFTSASSLLGVYLEFYQEISRFLKEIDLKLSPESISNGVNLNLKSSFDSAKIIIEKQLILDEKATQTIAG